MNQHTFMDNSGPLGALRRRDLEALAKKHGVQISHDDPAWKMREALRSKNVIPERKVPVPEPEKPELESMSLFQLRSLCKERGLSYKKTDKKIDLLLKLGA